MTYFEGLGRAKFPKEPANWKESNLKQCGRFTLSEPTNPDRRLSSHVLMFSNTHLKTTCCFRMPKTASKPAQQIQIEDSPKSQDTMVHIPNVLKNMKKLRYPMLHDELSSKTKLELSGLVKLETLKNFSLKHSSVKDLINMTKLRNLWICCDSDNLEEEVLPLSLGVSLKHLEELMLYNKRNSQAQPVKIDAGAFVSGFLKLNQLRLYIKIEKLPNELQFPARIASVSLSSCDLPEDTMPVLEKLHNLKMLSLEVNAFTGRKMVCSKAGFPKLHTLEFSILDNLEEWVVEEESMPCLCRLEINDCRKLKNLPDGLRYITTLDELRVGWMENEFKDKSKVEKITTKYNMYLMLCFTIVGTNKKQVQEQ